MQDRDNIEWVKSNIKITWCKKCKMEIRIFDIKRGTVSCPRCRRRLEQKELLYPEGMILVYDSERSNE